VHAVIHPFSQSVSQSDAEPLKKPANKPVHTFTISHTLCKLSQFVRGVGPEITGFVFIYILFPPSV
jgi:hypothetical protein